MSYIRDMLSSSTHRVSQYIDPGTIDSCVLRLQELHRSETIYNKNECLFSYKKMINYYVDYLIIYVNTSNIFFYYAGFG